MMQLAQWISRYYCAALGAVIEAIVPAAVRKKTGVGYTAIVRLNKSRDEIQATLETTKVKKRRSILARLLQLEPDESIELPRLAGEAGVTPATVRRLVALGLVTIRLEADLPRFADRAAEHLSRRIGAESTIDVNPDQERALRQLQPRLTSGQFSVNLLYGVTGSGKTEVYLRAIRTVVDSGRQAIVLVPEIALEPQTVKRFTSRFDRVAILHSGLTATERHRYWQQIAAGHADVVIGARSAIFAPLPRLGIIVVDEEHESTYKSDNIPRYNARDVAIKRAQLEGIPVILGSATPSLESWSRLAKNEADRNGYHLLRLPARVRGLKLPHVELVDLRNERRLRRGVHLISQRLETLLRHTADKGEQAILLLNRRGYSNFVVCNSCAEVIHCKYCDTTMTYHRSAGEHPLSAKVAAGLHTGQLHCHYCLAVSPLPASCPACQKSLSLFGLGTQRVEEELARKFPDLRFARVDSDTMRGTRDYIPTLAKFASGQTQVLLGTQMIAKGLDYPNVTLVGVISGDTALSLPDFRASERTMQLITQVAGRAGRGDSPGRVVVQTLLPDDPAIRFAIKQDFEGFANSELPHRREVGLPPITRMARIVVRDQDIDKANATAEQLAVKLSEVIGGDASVRLRGPMPCAISRIAGYFRVQIELIGINAKSIQRVLATVRSAGALAKNDRIAVDVDPVSLL